MRAHSGFSLLELLVALAVLAVLTTGMAQVFLATLQSYGGVHGALATQRTLRWAFSRMEDDLRMAGFLFPPPWLRPMPPGPGAGVVLLRPGQPLAKVAGGALVPLEPGDDPGAPLGRTADVLSLVMDQPLAVTATLAAALPASPQSAYASVALVPDRAATVPEGALLWVEGDRFECVRVCATVTLRPGQPAAVPVAHALDGPAFAVNHPAGARVGFTHPLRLVCLRVVYLPLPEARGLVPCLVRLEAPYGEGEAEPRWAEWLAQPAALPAMAEILAEQVTGFRVELSQATLASQDPLDGRRHPAVLSLTLEARSGARRETLRRVFRPRNFGLEAWP